MYGLVEALSGMTINMDSKKVGELVSSPVFRQLANGKIPEFFAMNVPRKDASDFMPLRQVKQK